MDDGPLVETTVRLVSWNVWGRYGPWEMREQAITGTLGPGDPDIVALAEAWESEQDGQCARLGEQLGRSSSHRRDRTGCAPSGRTAGRASAASRPR
jgi:hypothetical protein